MHEHEQFNIDGADREFEAALRGLKPGPATIDPLTCAFEAGQVSASRRATAYRSTAAALSVALVISVLIPIRVTSQPARQASDENYATLASLPARTNQGAYLTTRNAVLERGVDVLPASTGSAKPMSMRGL